MPRLRPRAADPLARSSRARRFSLRLLSIGPVAIALAAGTGCSSLDELLSEAIRNQTESEERDGGVRAEPATSMPVIETPNDVAKSPGASASAGLDASRD